MFKLNIKNRNKAILKVSIFGILTNLFLGIIKLIIGIIIHSISIILDASNNISDTFSSILTLSALKLSTKEPDKKHPYGYARYEYIAALVISLIMISMGIMFIKESIIKIIYPEILDINIITYMILIIAIIVKLIQISVYKSVLKVIDSKPLTTTMLEARNDIISNITILISMIIMSKYNINLDGYLALLVSIFIVFTSIGAFKDVLEPLIGIEPDIDLKEKIIQKLYSYKEVLGIHDLIIHNYGVLNNYITVHIELDSSLDIIDAYNIINKIEYEIKKEMYINITIHMDLKI